MYNITWAGPTVAVAIHFTGDMKWIGYNKKPNSSYYMKHREHFCSKKLIFSLHRELRTKHDNGHKNYTCMGTIWCAWLIYFQTFSVFPPSLRLGCKLLYSVIITFLFLSHSIVSALAKMAPKNQKGELQDGIEARQFLPFWNCRHAKTQESWKNALIRLPTKSANYQY